MASYIEGYCDAQMPPPYEFRDVTVWSFPLLADAEAVGKLIDRFLLTSPLSKSRPQLITGKEDAFALKTMVYMMTLDYGRMWSSNPPEGGWGYLSQNEFLIGFPVIVDGILGFFSPYIFVDNPWSMICGNTVLGYPKQLAWFQVSGPDANPYPIKIDTSTFVRYSRDTPLTWQRLVDIDSPLAAALPLPEPSEVFHFGPIEKLFGDDGPLPIADELLDQLKSFQYDIVQLKQFRSAQFTNEACYQALVFCTVKDELNGGGLLPPANIRLATYSSLNLRRDLGLGDGPLVSLFPYWMRCNMQFSNAREIPTGAPSPESLP